MTDRELDAWFEERRTYAARRRAELALTLRAVLASGGTVREWYREDRPRGFTDWNCATTTFVEGCRNADYLTAHLLARQGFGYRLELTSCF